MVENGQIFSKTALWKFFIFLHVEHTLSNEHFGIQGVPRVVENNETGDSRGKMQQILLCDIFR